MSRNLTVFLPLESSSAFTVLGGDPQWWLPSPASAAPQGWVVSLHAGPVTHAVLCQVGPAAGGADGLWRPLAWEPSDTTGRVRPVDRFLPRLTGEIGVMLAPAPTLVLTGSYDPPGAALGSVAARAGLQRVADATARRFVADVAKRVAAAAHAAAEEAPLALR